MSAARRVTSPDFRAAATTRVSSAKNVATISFPKIDGISGSNPTGPNDESIQYDESFQQPQQNNNRQLDSSYDFYDFTSYAAVSYLDEVIANANFVDNQSPEIFPMEIMRGVGQYEINMRVISGIDQVSGESYNRLF